MSLKKLLTGKPGNIMELLEGSNPEDVIQVTYQARNYDHLGVVSITARIVYEIMGHAVKVDWDNKYGSVIEGKEKESIIESLKVQAKKDLKFIKDSGRDYTERIDVPNSFV